MQASNGKNPHSDQTTDSDGILNTVKPLLKEVDVGVLQSIGRRSYSSGCLYTVAVNTLTMLLQSTQTKHTKGLVQRHIR